MAVRLHVRFDRKLRGRCGLCVAMPPRKRKDAPASADAAAAAPAKKAKAGGKGGATKGGGRPTNAEALAKAGAAAVPGKSIAAMFGARTPAAAAKTPPAFVADLKRWNYLRHRWRGARAAEAAA